jgi:Isopentenyldiphosphate isomerase
MDEEVALVAADGMVLGGVPRSRMRAENLRHAASAVLLRNSVGDLYVHRRSPLKDWCPSAHDAACGGVIRFGEDPAENAPRELGEELGVFGAVLEPLGTWLYEDDTVRVLEYAFQARWDGPVHFADGEIVSGEWLSLEALGSLLADPSWAFVPDTRNLLSGLAHGGVGDYARLLS